MKDVLAIVGSTSWPNEASLLEARRRIEEVLDARRPDEIISGGAPGIDRLAVIIAHERGIPCREFLPRNRRWAPDGFKARNIEIAEECTRLLAIRSSTSTTFGSGWTANHAEHELGKPVRRIMI